MTADRIREIIAEYLGDADFIDRSRLDEDLHCDSLDTVELAMEFEDTFGIEIDDDEFNKLATVGDVVKYVEGICNSKT